MDMNNMKLDPTLICKFRDFVNEHDLIYHLYHNKDGKDQWSVICSAMDWIEVTVTGIDTSKLIYSNTNESSISAMTLINCIDVMWEGIRQLGRVFLNEDEIFKEDSSVFHRSVSDTKYWKIIRAIFSAHPVNLDNITGIKKGNERWFASWSGSFTGGRVISVFIYSNMPGKEPEKYDLIVSEIMKFAMKRYEYLNELIEIIKKDLHSYIKKKKEEALCLLDSSEPQDVIMYIDYLLQQNQIRWSNSYYKERLHIIQQAFTVNILGRNNCKTMELYRKDLLCELEGIRETICLLDYKHQHFEVDCCPPRELLYAYELIFDSAKAPMMWGGIQKMQDFFGSLINYSKCRDEVEIRVLTRAALWVSSHYSDRMSVYTEN